MLLCTKFWMYQKQPDNIQELKLCAQISINFCSQNDVFNQIGLSFVFAKFTQDGVNTTCNMYRNRFGFCNFRPVLTITFSNLKYGKRKNFKIINKGTCLSVWRATNETPSWKRKGGCYQRNSHCHSWPTMNQIHTWTKYIWDYEGTLGQLFF